MDYLTGVQISQSTKMLAPHGHEAIWIWVWSGSGGSDPSTAKCHGVIIYATQHPDTGGIFFMVFIFYLFAYIFANIANVLHIFRN